MSVFFTKIKSIWDEIDSNDHVPACVCTNCTCTLTQKVLKSQQDQRLMMFLMKLNDNFSSVRTNILMMQPLPNLQTTYRLCVQEEKHKQVRQLNTTPTEPMEFSIERRRFTDRNHRGGYQGQNA